MWKCDFLFFQIFFSNTSFFSNIPISGPTLKHHSSCYPRPRPFFLEAPPTFFYLATRPLLFPRYLLTYESPSPISLSVLLLLVNQLF